MLKRIKQRFVKGPTVPPLAHTSTVDHIMHNDAVAAVLLLCAALSAFVLANLQVPLFGETIAGYYHRLWQLELGIALHHKAIEQPLHAWINDGLMCIFFFVVGLEIKRELLVGELASLRKAMLPIVAAIGGMVCPALLYTVVNWGSDAGGGWGIPMATDIAFAAGVLGLLSRRVPQSLAVFLIALAIVDDLGSVLVIALFYTDKIDIEFLEVGLGLIAVSFILARLGVRNTIVFVIIAHGIWLAFLGSGVHATVAGVLFALTIPADNRYDVPLFRERIQSLLDRFHTEKETSTPSRQLTMEQQQLVRSVEDECIHVEAPLQRIENKLHPITAFVIMPLFAFANSGVALEINEIGSMLTSRVTLGVIFGLLVGKQVGVLLPCWLAVKLGIAELPRGVNWKLMYCLSWLAGIGFTMSLFIGQLAFIGHGAHEPGAEALAHLAESKLGTLAASTIAGVVGTVLLILVTRGGNLPVDDAEGALE